jgi:hypothetical protein
MRGAVIGVLVAVAPAVGGCTAAPLALGPVMSAIQLVGDRAVDRSFAADRESTWAAVLHTLSRLELPVEHADRQGERWTVRGGTERLSVNVELVALTPKLSRVSLRIEGGGLTPDKKSADEILNQVGQLLGAIETARRESPRTAPADDERITALTEEVKRLRSGLEAREPTPAPVAPAAAPQFAPGGIITIPAGAGVPIMAAPSAAAPGTARTPFVTDTADKGSIATPATLADSHGSTGNVVAPALSPVETMSPVRPLGAPGAGR